MDGSDSSVQFEVLFQHFPGGMRKAIEKFSRDSVSSDWDSDPRPYEYEAEGLPIYHNVRFDCKAYVLRIAYVLFSGVVISLGFRTLAARCSKREQREHSALHGNFSDLKERRVTYTQCCRGSHNYSNLLRYTPMFWIHFSLSINLRGLSPRANDTNRATARGKSYRYPFDRRSAGPQSRSGRYGELKILDPTWSRTPTPRSCSP
jgi:hypothetical protein